MTDVLLRLSLATLTSSAAMVLVLALRTPLRRLLRAQAAYVLWAVVPLAASAALLPSKVTIVTLPYTPPVDVARQVATIGLVAAPSSRPDDSTDVPADLVWLWLAGAAATLAIFLLQQRRFVRGLGRLSRVTASVRRAETAVGCPALVGAWSPHIVLPIDFERRYSAIERSLILAHERHHRSHGDAQINMLCMLLRSVFWFNPLIHYAAAQFRLDQELACDAAVIRAFRGRRRSYARAMLKAQLPSTHLPLGCYWPAGHALKERIVLLHTPVASPLRIGLGAASAIALVMIGTVAAWAAQPARTEILYTRDTPNVLGDPATNSVNASSSQDATAIDHPARTQAAKAAGAAAPTTSMDHPAAVSRSTLATGMQRRSMLETASAAKSPQRADTARRPAANPGAQTVAAAVVDDEHRADLDVAAVAVTAEPAVTANADATTDRPAEAIPSYRTLIPPVYPAAAVRMPGPRASSTILLKVDVDEHGNPLGAQVASMDPPTATELATASIAAVLRWQFNPALHDGKAIAGVAWVPFEFVLEGGATSPPLGEITDGRVAPQRRASYRTLTAIDYPQADIIAGVEGVVFVKLRVEADGRVASLAVDRVEPASARSLANAAVAGMSSWTFNPARIAGRDIASNVTVPIVFTRQRGRRWASNGHDYPGTLDPVMAIPKG